jgi:GNAT superfamily N-acetyltransferase
MQPIVREARPDDAVRLTALLSELGYPSPPDRAERHIKRFLDDPASRLAVAESPDGVIGLVATHIVLRLDGDEYTCRITDLVVARSHRRRGVGTALLEAAARHARQAGARRLDLTSGDWRDEAHGLYLARGFENRARGFTKRLDG